MSESDVSQSARIAAVERRPAVTRLNSDSEVKGVLSGDALVNWVTKSCLAQKVPLKVTDPRVVGRVRTLLSGTPGGPERSGSPAGPTGSLSQSPDRLHPVGVEHGDTLGGGFDDGVEHHGFDDGLLAVEV